jgi:hypothetical protein
MQEIPEFNLILYLLNVQLKLFFCFHGMASSQIAKGQPGLQIWRTALDMLQKQ